MKEKIEKVMLFLGPLMILLGLNFYLRTQSETYMGYFSIIIFYCIITFVINTKNKYLCIENIHKIRYIIASVLFIILVAFKFSGSSIGYWDNYYKDYGGNSTKTIYTGKVRGIRSDEWLVQTPLYLSQLAGDKFLPRINDNIRSEGMDMALAAYSPVLDVTMIGKPFNWGFLFLDKERAISWYWNLKLIGLFMLSYEMSLMFSKRNKKVSLLGAALITFAPASQWWFSTSVVDVIIFSQGAIIGVYYYFRREDIKKKLADLCLFSISGIGFILSLYPPVQVPLGYLSLILFIYLIIKNKNKIKKKDIACFSISVIFILSVVGYFIITAKESIAIMFGTVYPGQRVELGGNYDFKMLSNYVFGWLLPYKEITFSNSSEASGFVSLLPLTVILFLFRKKDDEDNKLLVSIFIYMLIILSFLIIPYPQLLAKATLFSYVPTGRMALTLGLTSTYLLIMLFSNMKEKKKGVIVSLVVTAALIFVIFYPQYKTEVQLYLLKRGVLASVVIFAAIIYLAIRGFIRQLIPYAITFMIITGFFVNPVSRTLAPIYEKEVSKAIVNVNKEEPGKWASIDELVGGDFLYANGVKTFNGVQNYPDINMWKKLDVNDEYSDVYNRYAHVIVDITKANTEFVLVQGDVIKVNININDLSKIGVKYFLTRKPLEEFNSKEKTLFTKIYYNEMDKTYIYKYAQ